MDIKESQMAIINALAENEESVSRLYEAYALKFEEHRDFWADLAIDEKNHAHWIHSLSSKIGQGSVLFNENRFNSAAITTFHNYVERKIVKAQDQSMSSIIALSTTLYIEQAWIERKYFEVLKGDSIELKNALINLAQETRHHLDRVKELWSNHRQSNSQG